MNLEKSKRFWRIAGGFPTDKESVYPDHAKAHGFDDLGPRSSVLEYGCGGGSDTMSLLRRDHVVTYCDIVPENVALTRERTVAMARSKLATGVVLERTTPLPFGKGVFDFVTSHGVIHHIADEFDREDVMCEFHRVLVPGGRLAVMLYTEHLWAKSKAVTCQEFGAYTDGPGCYAKAYTEEEGRDFLALTGFQVERVTLYHEDLFRTFMAKAL